MLARKLSLIIAMIIIFIVHLGLSMKFPISSDSANVLHMANDITKGNIFLKGWVVGNESFYTTDTLFYAIGILISGFHYELGYIVSALMYTAVVFLVYLLSKREGNLIQQLLVISAIAIPSQFLATIVLWPAVHTGSMVFVLFALWWLYRKQNYIWYGVFMILACVGDPFVIYISVLPLLLISAIRWLIFKNKYEAFGFVYTLASVAISKVVLNALNHFGGFTFFPGFEMKFVALEQFGKNLTYLLGGLLELYNANFFGKPIFESYKICFHLVIVAGILLALYKSIRKDNDSLNQFLWVACLINVAEYTFSNLMVDLGTTRYLFPFFVFSAILAARSEWGSALVRNHKKVAIALTVLIIASYLTPIDFKSQKDTAVVSFLQSKNLTHGFGSYWMASSLTVASDEKISINPVMVYADDIISPMLIYANKNEYKKESHFVLFPNDFNDGDINQKTAEKTFGKPDEVHQIRNVTVLMWNKNIALEP